MLRVFASHFDREQAAALDTELKWYAAALGEVRDLEVLQQHLLADLAELPVELVLGPVQARLSQTLDAELARARRKLATVMRSKRYLALLNELHSWSIDTPFSSRPEKAEHLTRYVSKTSAGTASGFGSPKRSMTPTLPRTRPCTVPARQPNGRATPPISLFPRWESAPTRWPHKPRRHSREASRGQEVEMTFQWFPRAALMRDNRVNTWQR